MRITFHFVVDFDANVSGRGLDVQLSQRLSEIEAAFFEVVRRWSGVNLVGVTHEVIERREGGAVAVMAIAPGEEAARS